MNTLKESLSNALDSNFNPNRIDENNNFDAIFAGRKFGYWTEKNFDDLVSHLIAMDDVDYLLDAMDTFRETYASMLPEDMQYYIFDLGKFVSKIKKNPAVMKVFSYAFKDFLKAHHITLEQMPDYSKSMKRVYDKYAKKDEFDEFEDATMGNWGI